jgi:hypothetical protein
LSAKVEEPALMRRATSLDNPERPRRPRTPAGSFPAQLTSLIEREQETVAARDILRREGVRLLTSARPGGEVLEGLASLILPMCGRTPQARAWADSENDLSERRTALRKR